MKEEKGEEEEKKDVKEVKEEKGKCSRLVTCGSYKPVICKNVLCKKTTVGIKQNYEKAQIMFQPNANKEEKNQRKASAFSPHISSFLIIINYRFNSNRKII